MSSGRLRSHHLWLPTILLLLLFGLSLSACGDSTSGTTATPTKTPTAGPDDLPIATDTPGAPASPQSTPTATLPPPPKVLPTVDDPTLIGNGTLPDNVAPFTALEVPDPSVLEHMAVAVKISNSPIVRPQSGLSTADIVIEHLAEGGITRFTAVYHSQDAERIGSVRSARLIDLEIPVLFDSFLVYSGASGEVTRLLDSSDFADTTLSDVRGDPGFYRLEVPGRAYDHTLFTDTQLLWQIAESQNWTDPPRQRGWVWSHELPEDVDPATTVEIPYSEEYSDVQYLYNSDPGLYQRSILGKPHLEELTGEQLTAANVVVLYVHHVDTLITEDVLGSKSMEIQLWGQGPMQLFRDGVAKEGIWLRPNRDAPLLFVDGNFKPIPLKPGNTWIQIVPLDMDVTFGE
ncbi:MAG: DUF3048 domain-containing protein [Chloroflexota bacterium]|nr:DUF3048 domain-containing protein [Chloroflexota bacterium]